MSNTHLIRYLRVYQRDQINDKLLEQELLTLPEHPSTFPVLSGVHITRSLVSCVCFVDRCLYFFFRPLCCLSFDVLVLVTPLVSSNSP